MKNFICIFAIAIIALTSSCAHSELKQKQATYDSISKVQSRLELAVQKDKQAYDSAVRAQASDSVLISMMGVKGQRIDSLSLVNVQAEGAYLEVLLAKP